MMSMTLSFINASCRPSTTNSKRFDDNNKWSNANSSSECALYSIW